MQGYRISDLSKKTQELIKQNNLDTNQDGRINDENGELAELLSKTGKEDINQLVYDNWWQTKKNDVLFGTALGTVVAGKGVSMYMEASTDKSYSSLKKKALKMFADGNPDKPIPLSEDVPRQIANLDEDAMEHLRKLDKAIGGDTYEYALKRRDLLQASLDEERLAEIARRKAHNQDCLKWKPKYSMNQVFKDMRKDFVKTNIYKGIGAGVILAGVALASYFVAKKPNNTIEMEYDTVATETETTHYHNEWQEKYSEVFGSETNLVEYTPQKGEYWISILQAKYSTDYETAQKMANKIKEMIYGDAKAAKQTPIMYLPETWNFEGKTYNYNTNAIPEKTTEYSDDVITEQGKMSKELEY